MARGSTAKLEITEKLRKWFGSDFITVQDNKIYVWENDGGERVQIAISMTCPKVGVETETPVETKTDSFFYEAPTAIPLKEKEDIIAMMERLNV